MAAVTAVTARRLQAAAAMAMREKAEAQAAAAVVVKGAQLAAKAAMRQKAEAQWTAAEAQAESDRKTKALDDVLRIQKEEKVKAEAAEEVAVLVYEMSRKSIKPNKLK